MIWEGGAAFLWCHCKRRSRSVPGPRRAGQRWHSPGPPPSPCRYCLESCPKSNSSLAADGQQLNFPSSIRGWQMSSLITAQIPLVPAGDVRTFPPPSLFPAPLPEPPFGSLSVPVCCITPGAPCTPPSFPFGVCPNALPAGHPHSQKPRSRLATGVATRSSPRWPLGEPSHQQVSWRGARWQPGRRRLLAGTGRGPGARGNLPGTPRPGDAAPAPCPALPPYKGLAPTRGARVSACPGDKESGCQGCC